MFRSKYKFSKNHGLLPNKPSKPHPSLITSIAILARNDTQTYHIHRSPNNPSIIMLFNEKQYMHRECTAVIDTSASNVLSELSSHLKLTSDSLTVYVTNNHDQCTANILGNPQAKDGLIWQCFDKLKQQKSSRTYLSLSVIGIQNENDLTDLLAVEIESQQSASLNSSSFQRRKIKVNKSEGKWEPTNSQIQLLQTHQQLAEALQRYRQIKNAIQYTAFMSAPKWDWLQGELYILSEIEIDESQQTILRTLKSHYILRINQYLRSVSPIMLKLGIQLRKMQQNISRGVTQNNESKIFRIINHCFAKSNDGLSSFKINLILEIGHYDTLKEEYQNLVPTSDLLSQRANLTQDRIQNASFLYLKHYEEYPSLVSLLGRVTNNIVEKELNSFIEPPVKTKIDYPLKIKAKSYVCDTYSSLQKRNAKKQLMIQDFANADAKFVDVEEFIRKTAKQYRNDEDKQEGNQFKRINKSVLKQFQRKSENRSNSLEWSINRQKSNQTPKIYASRNQAATKNQVQYQNMRSISYLIDNKFQRSKQRNSSHLQSVYGTHIRRNRELQRLAKQRTDLSKMSNRKGRKQNELADDLLQKQIIQLGKQDHFLKQSDSSMDQILQ